MKSFGICSVSGLVAVAVLGGGLSSVRAAQPLLLTPEPMETTATEGFTSVTGEWVVQFDANNADDLMAARELRQEARATLKAKLTTASLEADSGQTTGNIIALRQVPAEDDAPPLFATQGYRLSVREGRIEIAAPTAQGRYYGVQTLRQLMRGAGHEGIPRVEIRDWPALEWRGISDDISRGQISTIADFKRILANLAQYKINMYQPYIEDMFEFDANPAIGEGRGRLTKAEFKQMVDEARLHHIALVPIFETLGHQDRMLSIADIRPLAENTKPETRPWSFAPANKDARAFVKRLISEIAELTPGPFFHIGGDEAYDVGEGQSAELVKKDGRAVVEARYFKEMADYLRDKHHLQTLMYGDMLISTPEAFKELPQDAILIDWGYSGTHESTAKIKAAGVKNFFVSPGIWSWGAFYPAYRPGFDNVYSFTNTGKEQGAMGAITSSWGDDGSENLRQNNMTGYAYSGAAAWQRVTPTMDVFMRPYVAVQYGVDSPSLADVETTLGTQILPEGTRAQSSYHVTLKIREPNKVWRDRMTTMKADMEVVRKEIAKARKTVRREADHLDSLDHAAKRYLYMADRDLALGRVTKLLGQKKSGELSAGKRNEIRTSLTSLRDRHLELTSEYARLWLKRNKYPMLQTNLERLERQNAQLQDFIVQLEVGDLQRAPSPRGMFMWHPDDADPFTTTAEDMTYFSRLVKVKKPVAKVEIHAWGDDRCTLFVQGEKPGGRVGTATFNAVAAEWVASPGFTVGDNVVSMSVKNGFGAGVAICTIDIHYQDGTQETITGDKEWKTTRNGKLARTWFMSPPAGKAWKPVRLLGKAPLAPWTSMDW